MTDINTETAKAALTADEQGKKYPVVTISVATLIKQIKTLGAKVMSELINGSTETQRLTARLSVLAYAINNSSKARMQLEKALEAEGIDCNKDIIVKACMLAMGLVSDVNAYIEASDLDADGAEKAHKRGVAKAQRIKRCTSAVVGLIDDDDFALKADFQTIFEFIKGTDNGIEGVISLGKQSGALKRQKQNRKSNGKNKATGQAAPEAAGSNGETFTIQQPSRKQRPTLSDISKRIMRRTTQRAQFNMASVVAEPIVVDVPVADKVAGPRLAVVEVSEDGKEVRLVEILNDQAVTEIFETDLSHDMDDAMAAAETDGQENFSDPDTPDNEREAANAAIDAAIEEAEAAGTDYSDPNTPDTVDKDGNAGSTETTA